MPSKPDVDPWLMSRRLQAGARIRSLRLDQNYTQEGLAARAGVSRDTVIYAETGRKAMSIDTANLLARALDVPVARLFSDDSPRLPGDDTGGGALLV